MRLIVPSIDHRPASRLVGEPSAPILSTSPRPTESRPRVPRRSSKVCAAVRSASPPHRRAPAPCSASSPTAPRPSPPRARPPLRARPDLTDTERTPIARAMARFRNQLLHHPRSTLPRPRPPKTLPMPPPARRRPPPLRPGRRHPRPRRAAHSRQPPEGPRQARPRDDRQHIDESGRTDEMLSHHLRTGIGSSPRYRPDPGPGNARPDGRHRGHLRHLHRPGEDRRRSFAQSVLRPDPTT